MLIWGKMCLMGFVFENWERSENPPLNMQRTWSLVYDLFISFENRTGGDAVGDPDKGRHEINCCSQRYDSQCDHPGAGRRR